MIVLKITQAPAIGAMCDFSHSEGSSPAADWVEHLHGGKTFKGLTDATLAWQTERFLELETHREGITVFVRPAVVAEIALDGVQVSTRYPGGVTLRFARLKRYRDDKSPAEADTIESVRELLHRPDAQGDGSAGHSVVPSS